MESAESNLAEQHLREYSLSQHKLDGDVSTSMVELGLNDAGNLPSRKLKLFVSSWNMGNEPAVGLEYLIPANGGGFDVFAFGMQESTYEVKKSEKAAEASAVVSPPENTSIADVVSPESKGEKLKSPSDPESGKARRSSMSDTKELLCVEILTDTLQRCLGDDFYLVVHNRRVQMQLFVFARRELEQSISHIEKSSENTGFLHVFPNKGGINVSMSIDGTTLAFVSCHLAAHEGVSKCASRNQSCYEILEGIRSGIDQDLDVAVQFHHTIWMGDMNYRTTFDPRTPSAISSIPMERQESNKVVSTSGANGRPVYTAQASNGGDDDKEDGDEFPLDAESAGTWEENRQEVFKHIAAGNYSAILARDELNRELAANRTLMGFTALQPAFNPTFKRKRRMVLRDSDKGTDGVSVESYYDHKRMPSYTDRILYCSLPGFVDDLSPIIFDSCEETDSSDHKPVYAKFVLSTHGGARDIKVPRSMLQYVKNSKKHVKLHSQDYTEFKIANMKGHNLAEMDLALFGVGGKSDPYVRVTVDPPSAVCKMNSVLESRVIRHELNPDWGKEELTLVCWGSDMLALAANVHILLSVWDWDLGNPSDLIGTCSIPLSVVIAASEKCNQFKFRLPLLRNGTFQGELEGTISRCTLKNKKQSHIKLGGASAVSIVSDEIPLDEFLEKLNTTDGMGCGCIVS